MKSQINEELNEISPFLGELSKKLPEKTFEIPADYFEKLADSTIGKAKKNYLLSDTVAIGDTSSRAKKNRNLFGIPTHIVRPLLGVAATLLLFLVVRTTFNASKNNTSATDGDKLSSIKNEVLKSFISENIEDFDENMLVETGVIPVDDFNIPSINLQDRNTDKDLKDYLFDNFDTPDDEDL